MQGQGKVTVKIQTKKNGDVKKMMITGRARPSQSIEFDGFIIDSSKKCDKLKGNLWNEKKLDSDPYGSGQYDENSERLKWRVSGGNGYVGKNKHRSLLYMQGETVVACGKLKKKNKKCKYTTDVPSTMPVSTVTVVPTVAPTVVPTVAPTSAPINVPSVIPAAVTSSVPVATTTDTPIVAPSPAPTYPQSVVSSPLPTTEELGDPSCIGDSNTAIFEQMQHAQYGYALPQSTDPSDYRPFIPFHNNKGIQAIFNTTKIAQHLTDNFVCDTQYDFFSISESSISEFAHELSVKTMVGAQYSELGETMKASVAANFKLQTRQTEETFYSQSRHFIRFGESKLPFSTDKTMIQSLMDPQTLEDIQNLTNFPEKADDLVARIGIGYLSSVTLGSLFTMTSLVKSESWMTSTDIDTSVDLSYSDAIGGISASSSIEVEVKDSEGKASNYATYSLELYGGDPIAASQNEDKWIESTKENPVIVDYQVSPIYDILPADSSNSSAYVILKIAVNKAIDNFAANIPGFDYKPIIRWVESFPSTSDALPGGPGPVYIPVYIPKSPYPGFLPFGHGYSDIGMPTVYVDGIKVKKQSRYAQVWTDHGSGWNEDFAIWVPTQEDSNFYPLGYVVTKSHHEPTMDVAMLHSSLCEPNVNFGGAFWNSREHIGGSHSIDLYESFWPEWPNVAAGRYHANLISSIGIVPGFDFHLPVVAAKYDKITYNSTHWVR